MRTMPRVTHARSGAKEYEIYVSDLLRRIGSLAGSGRYPSLTRPSPYRPVPAPARTVSIDLFEDA